LSMLALSFWEVTLAVLFIIVCALLILIVLLQKGRGGGLGAAFSGAGSSAFGTRTGDVFTWITIVLTVLFLVLAIGTTLVFRPPAGVVSQPILKPRPPGRLGEENKVEISCPTQGAAIYYTTDGTEPVPGVNAIPYEGQKIPVHPGQTLKAIATRADWKNSRVRPGLYGVEPELPPIELQPDGPSLPAEGEDERPPATEPGTD